jgi:ribosomal protein S18 acetylase RimI-like enzyme
VPDDHVALRALRLRALSGEPAAFGSTYERELGFGDDVWRHRLRPDGNPHVGAFDDGDHLVGLAAGAVVDGDPTTAELLSMWVDPPFRGGPVAGALVAAVVTWAAGRGCTTMVLSVTDGNVRAERFYRRLGFARTGRGEVRERDGMREVEMSSPIAPAGERGSMGPWGRSMS